MQKTTSELIDQLRRIGHKLDTATDPQVMRFLITGRKAIVAALEAARVPEKPYEFVGMSPDGLAIYED
jgi:hypothetical protein